MPSSRRRRFLAQNSRRNPAKTTACETASNGAKSSKPSEISAKSCNDGNKSFPYSTIAIEPMEMVAESDEVLSFSHVKKSKKQDVENFNINSSKNSPTSSKDVFKSKIEPMAQNSKRYTRSTEKNRREKYQHRARVRSPRNRTFSPESSKMDSDDEAEIDNIYKENKNYQRTKPASQRNKKETAIKETVGTNTDPQRAPEPTVHNIPRGLDIYDRASDHSIDDMCRICHGGESLSSELGSLISACNCRGTVGRVHLRCLERWLTESSKSRCELCGTRYNTRRVHKYGVLKALVMWFMSQNAKQLMVDSLGIVLMSPLAVLAAWLSGRTLAGLMMQGSQVTPWPLASTFVLACMTLVCYYCWIVSAATRHALGWWVWYRAQYEVRLQILDDE